MALVETLELRARFARNLSDLYGTEVPAYTTLLAVAEEVNQQVLARLGDGAERLGSIERVTAERHGAIRVGTPRELSQVARIFGALGMYPTGFYDLRDAAPAPIPVVSTAFRPHDRNQLARNPFRVFVSMLVPEDERFFDADLSRRLLDFLGSRTLFPDELLSLADSAEGNGGLEDDDAERFLELATAAFALSPDPVDRAWYDELERVSSVAADIGGVGSTHINHLTPRVLDIDELYRRMAAHGVEMIDQIQGPPRWDGPDLLLRQTSFRALAEPRLFREGDGRIVRGDLRVRFGEVEARGAAPTPDGRRLYDRMLAEADERSRDEPGRQRDEVLRAVWEEHLPRTDADLARGDLAYYTFEVRAERPEGAAPGDLVSLLDGGWVEATPIVYEDFLPRSAAGIFASNLSGEGSADASRTSAHRDRDWLSEQIGRPVVDPDELYSKQRDESLRVVADALGLHRVALPEIGPPD
ncbi:MAG: 2-oxoadipate dioxygenase/decarboxylase family protein [Terrabacter sp.]